MIKSGGMAVIRRAVRFSLALALSLSLFAYVHISEIVVNNSPVFHIYRLEWLIMVLCFIQALVNLTSNRALKAKQHS